MSARAQRAKSIGSTFSSMSVTRCCGGVSAASNGSDAGGETAFARRNGRAYSNPYMEISKRGAMRTMSATCVLPGKARFRLRAAISVSA